VARGDVTLDVNDPEDGVGGTRARPAPPQKLSNTPVNAE
jgi:hypothetical protein